MNIIRQQIDFKMFPDFNHDFKEKLSKKAGIEIGFFMLSVSFLIFCKNIFYKYSLLLLLLLLMMSIIITITTIINIWADCNYSNSKIVNNFMELIT